MGTSILRQAEAMPVAQGPKSSAASCLQCRPARHLPFTGKRQSSAAAGEFLSTFRHIPTPAHDVGSAKAKAVSGVCSSGGGPRRVSCRFRDCHGDCSGATVLAIVVPPGPCRRTRRAIVMPPGLTTAADLPRWPAASRWANSRTVPNRPRRNDPGARSQNAWRYR